MLWLIQETADREDYTANLGFQSNGKVRRSELVCCGSVVKNIMQHCTNSSPIPRVLLCTARSSNKKVKNSNR